jgi:hypothetical protein
MRLKPTPSCNAKEEEEEEEEIKLKIIEREAFYKDNADILL